MAMSEHLLKRAIALWERGEKKQARKILETIIYNDRHNEKAWIRYIYSLESSAEKIAALETFLTLFPDHITAQKALAQLSSEAARRHAVPAEQTAKSLPVPTSQARTAQGARSRGTPWLLVFMGICIVFSSAIALFAQNRSLQSENRALEAQKRALETEYQVLDANHRALIQKYSQLGVEYQAVQARYQTATGQLQTLQDAFSSLQMEHEALKQSYDVLLSDYNFSVESYAEFRERAIVPPYIYIRGREVRLAFLTPDQQTYTWDVSFDSLENDLQRGTVERNKILFDSQYPRMTLNNTGTGEHYQVIDYRKFVDSSSFAAFSRYFYDQAPSEEAFIGEIWYIVAQLTAYSGEVTDTPRYPLETLLAGGGDCEDHAILFASMIVAGAPSTWRVYLVYMDSDHPTEPKTMNHLIVYIDTGNRRYTVEATGKQVMEPYADGVNGWYYEIPN